MASVDGLLPFLRKWEGGYVCDPDDLGGATNMGVTMKTFKAYCKNKGLPTPTVARLKRLSMDEWRDIVKLIYWNKFKADGIESQSVANICVDWFWMSGAVAIKRIQEIVGTKVDGVVGKLTLAAINNKSPLPLFGQIKEARKAYIDEICVKRPKNEKFRRGWMNRLNDIMYED